jgi:DNA replication protein DnaC
MTAAYELRVCMDIGSQSHQVAILADAILGRLLHNAIRLELKGDSMRKNKKHCKLEEAQQ